MNIVSTQYSLNTKSLEIYLAGCSGNPRCEGCHNPLLWDFNIGTPWQDWMDGIINKAVETSLAENIWILGGEPLDQDLNELRAMLEQLKCINKPLWLFTRFELNKIPADIKEFFDYIKTGRYECSLHDGATCEYGVQLASSNQHVHKLR